MASGGLRGIGDDVANIGTLSLPVLEELHQTALSRCLPDLMRNLNFEVVMKYIQQKELFDDVTVLFIMKQKRTSKKILRLIDQIKRRDQDTYERFKECLIMSQQEHLQQMLEEAEKTLAEEMKEKHQASAGAMSSAPTSDTDRFVCIAYLLVDVGSRVLRQLLRHHTVTSTCSLDQYLAKNINTINSLRRVFNQFQMDIMFPPNGGDTNLDDYDIILLSALFQNIVPTLSQQEKDMIKRLREERNKLYGHARSCQISANDFQTYWNDIGSMLTTLSQQCGDAAFEAKILQEIQRTKVSAIPAGSDLDILETWFGRIETVKGVLQDVTTRLQALESREKSSASPVIPAEILRMDEGSLKLYRQALKDGIEKVYSIRVMVVGHYGVGKTTLVQRLLGKDVNISERTSTEGIDIHMHCFDVSLTSQEWTVQEKDAEKNNRLQRLMTRINEKVQMANISGEEDGNKNLEEMERKSGAYASNVPYDDNIKMLENLKQKESEVNTRYGTGNNSHSDGKHFMASSGSEKNDPAMEILKLLVENAGKLERVKVAKAGLSLWDFAGQFVFYTTHQTFLTTRAVYLLVIDLSQQITDDVKDDECFFDREGMKVCKVYDFIEVWLNSIHTCSPSPEAGIPAVILVGTHADKIPQDCRQKVCESVFTQIRYQLQDKPTRFHLANEDFVIDNTVFDPKLEELKRKIVELASQQHFWGEEVPARWLHLEQLLMKLRDTGVKVIPYSLVESLNKKGSIQIETKEELDLFLRFLHDTGTILYFNTVRLREKIVLDPQWLINALKSLITAETFVLKDMAVLNKWYEFKEKGKLTLELIDAVWTKEKNPELHDNREHILLLMEQLNIVARPRSFSNNGDEVKVESYFIAPCMLRQMTPKEVITPEPNPQMESTSVLCYVFKEKFLPPAIFHRLFASCMACWSIAKNGKETLVFCGGCVFDLDPSHRLYLHFKDYVIFARITRMGIEERTPNGKLCLKVRESITEKLSEIIKGVRQRLDFEIGVQCPRCDGDSFDQIVRESVLQGYPEVACHCHDNSHVIRSRDLLKLWFEDSEKDKIGGPSSCLALNILDEVPLEKHLNRLSMKIGKEYVQLGIELDVPWSRIEQIQMENPRISTQCFKILQEWVQRDKSQATFRNLEKACRCVGIDVSILNQIF